MRNKYYVNFKTKYNYIMYWRLSSFLYTVYFGVFASDKIFFSCVSMSTLHVFKDSFLK